MPASNQRVDRPQNVRINDINYQIEGTVSRQLTSTFPPKLVTGDYSAESHPLVSTITWDDWRGGILKEIGDFPENLTRTFYTNLNVRYKGHAYLGTKPTAKGVPFGDSAVTDSANHDTDSTWIADGITSYDSALMVIRPGSSVVAAQRSQLYRVDSGGQSIVLSSANAASTGAQFESLYANLQDSTEYIALGNTGASFFQQGETMATDSWIYDNAGSFGGAPNHFVKWRNLLWAVNEAGAVQFTRPVSGSSWDWTNVTGQTEMQEPGTFTGVQEILVGPDNKLYFLASKGLYRYDSENERVFKVVSLIPGTASRSYAATVWQGSIFVAQGMEVIRYTPEGGFGQPATAEPMGLDLDDGLPAEYTGTITALTQTRDVLIAQVSPQDTVVGYPGFYSWNERGWSAYALPEKDDGTSGSIPYTGHVQAGTGIFVSDKGTLDANAPSSIGTDEYIVGGFVGNRSGNLFTYPLNEASGTGFERRYVPPTRTDSNRRSFTDWRLSASVGTLGAEMILPWMKADGNQTWNALNVEVEHQWLNASSSTAFVASSNNYIKLQYGKNLEDSFTDLGTIDLNLSPSETEFSFKTDGEDIGVPFTSLRLRAELGTNNSRLSPDINRLSLNFNKILEPLWGFSFLIGTNNQTNRSAIEVRDALKTLYLKKTLFRFTFQGDTANKESYLVRAIGFESVEGTGSEHSGQYRVSLTEV